MVLNHGTKKLQYMAASTTLLLLPCPLQINSLLSEIDQLKSGATAEIMTSKRDMEQQLGVEAEMNDEEVTRLTS